MRTRSLAKELSRWFSPHARARGRALAKCVSFVGGAHGFRAKVTERGSEYFLRIALADDALTVSCSCPLFVLGLDGCRHVWAVVLAADRSGVSAVLPRRTATYGRAARLALSGGAAIFENDTTSRARIETLSDIEGNRARLADAMTAATGAANVSPPIPRNGPRGASDAMDRDRVGRWKRETR